jgi:ABC-type branched-subunit amino acid transport system substrate-binding protein
MGLHHRRGLRTIAIAAGLSTATLGISALGASAQNASTPGVSDKEITLGYISSETGVAASASEGSQTGCQARIGAQNAAGGVNGRKIKL